MGWDSGMYEKSNYELMLVWYEYPFGKRKSKVKSTLRCAPFFHFKILSLSRSLSSIFRMHSLPLSDSSGYLLLREIERRC